MKRRTSHRLFVVGIGLKLLDGALEVLGAVLALVLDPDAVNEFVRAATFNELSEDPHDFIALHVRAFVEHVTGPGRAFAVVYLAAHGLAKLVLATSLLRHQRWAFPVMLVVLGAFVVYQCYLIAVHPTLGMTALTVFDVLVIWLVRREWRSSVR